MKCNKSIENISQFRKFFIEQNSSLNVHMVPSLSKICLSIRFGQDGNDKNLVNSLSSDLSYIAGQKAVISYAKFSDAGLKIREGQPISAKVTLRRNAMLCFLDRLMLMAMPRIRDFNGLNPNSIDKNFNYSFTIKDYTVFYEVSQDAILRNRGLDICINTIGCSSKENATLFLSKIGIPLKH
jgi:large subunit ribosomal protein L5